MNLLENMLKIEEKLVSEFEHIYIVLKNSKKLDFNYLKLERFFYVLINEEKELNLSNLKQEKLESYYFYIEKELYEKDNLICFEDIFYSENIFDPKVRLFYHLKLEWIKRKNKWQNYNDLFEFRLIKSFHDLHDKNNFKKEEEYLKLYLNILYTFPIIDFEGKIKINALYDKEKYQKYEKEMLEKILKKRLKELTNEKKLLYYNYIFTYLELAIEQKDKKWLDKIIHENCKREREKEILLRYSSISLNENILLLKRK